MTDLVEIDGADGGGQLLRSALALSAITGRDLRIESIRGDRPTPGLKAQHLAAVRLTADVCDAAVSEVAIGSKALTFRPGPIESGTYQIDVGTAGSVTLLFDTVLPLALASDGPIAVTATGGTDVEWSPSMVYYRRIKLPLLRSWGLHASVDLDVRGFYPAGGGRATLYLSPSSPPPLQASSRGQRRGARVYSVASADLADREVAERQAMAARSRLEDTGFETLEWVVTTATSDSTGSAVAVRLDYDRPVGFGALGAPGKPAEQVGREAANAAADFDQSSGGAVDPYMGDQLLLPVALAGGRIAIPERTDHLETSLELLEAFGASFVASDETEIVCRESISPPRIDR